MPKPLMNCGECPQRPICVNLCPKAEAYVNQDDNQAAWENVRYRPIMEEYKPLKPVGLSTTEAMLQNYFIDGMKVPQIAIKYDKSRQYVARIIKKYRALLIKNIKKSVYNSQ